MSHGLSWKDPHLLWFIQVCTDTNDHGSMSSVEADATGVPLVVVRRMAKNGLVVLVGDRTDGLKSPWSATITEKGRTIVKAAFPKLGDTR